MTFAKIRSPSSGLYGVLATFTDNRNISISVNFVVEVDNMENQANAKIT